MNLESWDPFERLDEFRRRSNAVLDQLLESICDTSLNAEPIAFQPEVDLVETDQDFRFYLSIPGMVEDDLVIEVDGEHVTIRGERRPPYDASNREAAMQEWRYGFFERHFELPTAISASDIRAAYDAGVLTIVAAKLTVQPFADHEGRQ